MGIRKYDLLRYCLDNRIVSGVWGLSKFEKEEKGLFAAIKNIGKFLKSFLLRSRPQVK